MKKKTLPSPVSGKLGVTIIVYILAHIYQACFKYLLTRANCTLSSCYSAENPPWARRKSRGKYIRRLTNNS
jgi:hypothetical protein